MLTNTNNNGIRTGILISDNVKKWASNQFDDTFRIYEEGYCNGREHGVCLVLLTPGMYKIYKFVIANDRHSDLIVVYFGEHEKFNSSGNIPSKDVYKGKCLFDADDFGKITYYITENIFNICERVIEKFIGK